MNFLAHLYLSGDSNNIKIGNFIGDYVKGKKYEKYPKEIQYGILLHRRIDTFTDSHPLVKQSKKKFSKKYHKYSGVITDIIYDHFLTKHWNEYSKVSLRKFINSTYQILLNNYSLLPIRVKQFLPYFIIYNWLGSYNTYDGLTRVFDRMAIKTSLPKQTMYAIEELKSNYITLNNEFNTFFPELIMYVLGDEVVKIA